MNSLHLKLTVFYFIFLQVFDVSCVNLGGLIEPPGTSLDPPQKAGPICKTVETRTM